MPLHIRVKQPMAHEKLPERVVNKNDIKPLLYQRLTAVMTQIDDFFIDKNRVDGITKADYERVRPKIEAVAAAARTTTNSIYIIDYHKRDFLYASENAISFTLRKTRCLHQSA